MKAETVEARLQSIKEELDAKQAEHTTALQNMDIERYLIEELFCHIYLFKIEIESSSDCYRRKSECNGTRKDQAKATIDNKD